MIDEEQNPDFLNDFLAYSSTILNKSDNTIKEYNYDISHFLKYIMYKYKLTSIKSEEEVKQISIKDLTLKTIEKITLPDIHAFLAYLRRNYNSKPATLARKTASIRTFFNYFTLFCTSSTRLLSFKAM